MDIKKIILYSALAFILYSLINLWQVEHPTQTQAITTTALNSKVMNDTSSSPLSPEKAEVPTSKSLITVRTNVLDIAIDEKGTITEATLLRYPISVHEKNTPFVLLNNTSQYYVAEQGVVVQNNGQMTPVNAVFRTDKTHYELGDNENTLKVTLQGETQDGLKITKIFLFKRDQYVIDTSITLQNNTSASWKGYVNSALTRAAPTDASSSMFNVSAYTGASYGQPGVHRYKKVTFKDMTKGNLNTSSKGGWIAMQQHYFLTSWIPNQDSEQLFYTQNNQEHYTIGMVSQPISLEKDKASTINRQLYLGPEDTDALKNIANGLDMTVDYGWLWFISSLIFKLLKIINSWVHNWGWSIVLVTVLIKLAFYRLSASSYYSMASMRNLQPKLQALRERYGDDKAKMSQETMKLYQQERVNPLGGCLPVLVQIPVFIALYWVLIESVELRQAPFIFWIKDLSVADPFHVLPILMGLSMFIQQKLNPAPPDPMQAKVMMMLPIVFTGLFWNFPAGLVLYWFVNNSLSIMQQWYITRTYEKNNAKK